MQADAEAATGAVWASKKGDPRVTPIGGILRRTRLDELPQLWNVLKGDMSFVGPRPERPEFVAGLTEKIRFYGQRHVVRPGLTGWAQVCYTYGATEEDALQKLQFDLYYIKNLSIALDLYIIIETIKTVVLRKGRLDGPPPTSDQRHDRRRGGLLPRQRVRRRGAARAMAVDGEPRAGQHRPAARPVRRVRRQGHVLRARLGGGALSRRWCGRSSAAGTSWRRTATPIGWSTTRRPTSSGRTCGAPRRCSRTRAGVEVRGYRAPSFSVTERSIWALDVLLEEGYRYDASIFPIRHDRYGIPDAPRWPHHVDCAGGRILRGARDRPCASAAPTCRWPAAATSASCPTPGRAGVSRGVNRHEQQPAVFYLHPWEIDPRTAAAAGQRRSAASGTTATCTRPSRACGR